MNKHVSFGAEETKKPAGRGARKVSKEELQPYDDELDSDDDDMMDDSDGSDDDQDPAGTDQP
jgi:hypothetical protein